MERFLDCSALGLSLTPTSPRDVSIPSTFSGQRGITPAFGYGAPHLSARGTSTLLDNALLSTRFAYSAFACFRMGMSRTDIGAMMATRGASKPHEPRQSAADA